MERVPHVNVSISKQYKTNSSTKVNILHVHDLRASISVLSYVIISTATHNVMGLEYFIKYRTPSPGQRVISRTPARNIIIFGVLHHWTAIVKDINFCVYPCETHFARATKAHILRTINIRNLTSNVGRKVCKDLTKCMRLFAAC